MTSWERFSIAEVLVSREVISKTVELECEIVFIVEGRRDTI